jgi:hypothetical protein
MSNEFDCPVCDEVVDVPIPYAKWITCPACRRRLEIHPDADFDGIWHDLTELSPLE